MSCNLSEKIALLNKLSDETLSITFYTRWTLNSYGKHSLFSDNEGCIGEVYAPDFAECINKAYRLVGEKMANEQNTV